MNPFLIVTPFRNAERFIAECAKRSLSQIYDNFRIVFVDDASDDNGPQHLAKSIDRHRPDSACKEVHVIHNCVRKYPLGSTHEAITRYGRPEDIVVIVDGDDWLLHDDVLTFVNGLYEQNNCWVTYGNAHWQPEGQQAVFPGPFSRDEIATLRRPSYVADREVQKRWRIHHLRTFRCWLYNEIGRRDPGWRALKDSTGSFYKAAGDVASMLALIEMAGYDHTLFNPINLYVYNLHDSNEHIVDHGLQWQAVRDIFAADRLAPCSRLVQAAAPGTGVEVCFLQPDRRGEAESFLSLSKVNPHALTWSTSYELNTSPNERCVVRTNSDFQWFEARVDLGRAALFDGATADFFVKAGDHLLASAIGVSSFDQPRVLSAPINDVCELELITKITGVSSLHYTDSVSSGRWIEPHVGRLRNADGLWWEDCLGRTEILVPTVRPRANRCITMVASPGFETFVRHALKSLREHGDCDDAAIALVCVGESDELGELAEEYGAFKLLCRPLVACTSMLKCVQYSVANLIDADQFICIDSDVLVLGKLSPLFAALEACNESSILVCREGNDRRYADLQHAFVEIYRGIPRDLRRILRGRPDLATYPLVANEGVFAANRSSLLALDSFLRGHEFARAWIDERLDYQWRSQFLFNLAIAWLNCGVELNPDFNVQLHFQGVDFVTRDGLPTVEWRGRKPRVIHFNGPIGRRSYARALQHFGLERTAKAGHERTAQPGFHGDIGSVRATRNPMSNV